MNYIPDQIDLDYEIEDLFFNIIDILLFFVETGASIISMK